MTSYAIKAIPTTYASVNFRSRLEARWAAFFDLCGWRWDYEPFDLEGWAPDFLIRTDVGPVLCEVKPYDVVTYIEKAIKLGTVNDFPFPDFEKAMKHSRSRAICLLGEAPLSLVPHMPIGLMQSPPTIAAFDFDELQDALTPSEGTEIRWRQAGNVVQWQAASNDNDNYHSQLRSIFKRKTA